MPDSDIKVLVVDDSAIVRKIFTDVLSRQSGIEVVGTAPDPYVARDKIVRLRPDVITLDIEMPRLDGLSFLKKLMQHYPLPVIIVSSLTKEDDGRLALEAIESGAVDVLSKPGGAYSVGEMVQQLALKIRAAAKARLAPPTPHVREPMGKPAPVTHSLRRTTHKVIAIGASTGGTEAIKKILTALPPTMPGIVIVQHMPPKFITAFSKRLNDLSELEVRESRNGDSVVPGQVLIARGNQHTLLRRSGARYYVNVEDGPMVNHQRPSINVLFESVAKYAGANAVGVILTGMGADGASGLLKMRENGARTIGQNEASCVVYGMPKEAAKMGAVEKVASLDRVPREILRMLE